MVERVVAVIGEDAILLSELRQRARPFLIEIQRKAPTQAQKAAAESELLRQMLQRMIDDRLEARAAAKNRISVSSEEIDTAIARLARLQKMTAEALMAEVMRSGMTAQEYRNEIQRQLLEGKLLELRVKGQVR
ncbi:MAG: SurA N-terminal domain-containing protein, partial [Polyangiaceae bacterium]|nr:SurA N-terminal domain-containing protein [Polyangiaceae bacterium]